MKIIEKECRTILGRTGVPSFDYCLNPYTGCVHACLYCYAVFMKKYSGHEKDQWGEFVEVKINAPEVLERQLQRIKKGRIWISSVCDPYQLIEKQYKITRQCLATLIDYPDSITIQTKSDLVLRDLDLLKKLNDITVGFTLTTLDEDIAKIFERRASSPQRRLRAIEKLKQEGIKTYVMLAPLIPYFSDSEEALKEIFEELKGVKPNQVIIDRMNYLTRYVGQRIRPALQNFNDEVKKAFDFASSPSYDKVLRERIRKAAENTALNYQIIF